MNSNSILTSNLLDIIFENRNKDYGAYVLRRDYSKRLFKSLFMTMGLAALFIILLMFAGKNEAGSLTIIPPQIPPTSVSAIRVIEPEKHAHAHAKSVKSLDKKRVIVKIDNVEKALPTKTQLIISNIGNNTEALPSEAINTGENYPEGIEVKEPPKPPVAVDRNVPINSPNILPQFPGGIMELIKFLKRNLNTPQQMEDGEEIGVKVKFIVSYNGNLMGFDVIETGGEPFDNEVIRVLKKMPKWIPGKASGEDVSTYFVIPVKFRVSD